MIINSVYIQGILQQRTFTYMGNTYNAKEFRRFLRQEFKMDQDSFKVLTEVNVKGCYADIEFQAA